MNLPPNIAALTEDALVVETCESIVSFYGREDVQLLSTANLEIATFLADALALTPGILAVLIAASHEKAVKGASKDIRASMRLFTAPLPPHATLRDLQATFLLDDTTASMLNHAVFMMKLRGLRQGLCAADGTLYNDETLQVEFFLNARMQNYALSCLNSDNNFSRFPYSFLRLCAHESGVNVDVVCKLNNQYIGGVAQESIEMIDALSHFSAQLDVYQKAYLVRKAQDDAAAIAKASAVKNLQTKMRQAAPRFKL